MSSESCCLLKLFVLCYFREGGKKNKQKKKTSIQLINHLISQVFGIEKVGVRLSPNANYGESGTPDFREQFSYIIKELGKVCGVAVLLHVGLARLVVVVVL